MYKEFRKHKFKKLQNFALFMAAMLLSVTCAQAQEKGKFRGGMDVSFYSRDSYHSGFWIYRPGFQIGYNLLDNMNVGIKYAYRWGWGGFIDISTNAWSSFDISTNAYLVSIRKPYNQLVINRYVLIINGESLKKKFVKRGKSCTFA